MSQPPAAAEQLLEFWFSDESRARWFDSTPEFDDRLRDAWLGLWQQARDGELGDWEGSARGALALVIVLDQLPLNMFRGRPESFSTERAACAVAGRAIDRGFDQQLEEGERVFLYLPYMHSEEIAVQECSVAMFEAAGMDPKWARHHRDIVARFGRFPHRNAILGRTSTAEELTWLASDEAFGG